MGVVVRMDMQMGVLKNTLNPKDIPHGMPQSGHAVGLK